MIVNDVYEQALASADCLHYVKNAQSFLGFASSKAIAADGRISPEYYSEVWGKIFRGQSVSGKRSRIAYNLLFIIFIS
jgi:hypothetical protein